MAGTLYLVPTPIGNLGDISRRCAETLEAVDFLAAEDTRVTLKLLNHLGLKKPLLSYYRHNTGAGGEAVLERLLSGEDGALVTDAGTPAVSDPGEELVAQCAERDIPVVAIPGPCALITALAVSGLPTGRFTFEGFLAMNKKNRRRHLESLRGEERTMIFYEAPHKLPATLSDLAETFGPDRPVRPEGLRQVGQCGGQLVGGLVEDHSPLLPPEGLQVAAAVLLVHGQKALEGEPAGGQAGHRQGGDQGAGAWYGHHRDVPLRTLGHQLLPRVGHRRGTRVGDQGPVLPGEQALQHRLPAGAGVVAVVGEQGLFQPQVVEQLQGHPGVLGGEEVHRLQRLGAPPGDVPQVADGCGH